MSSASDSYKELLGRRKEAATIGSITTLLHYDQETAMPPKAAPFRAEQLSLLSRLSHERHTDPRLGELIAACESDKSLMSDPAAAANLREIRRDFDKATKLPTDLVVELAKTTSRALEVWKEARAKKDFAMFRPALKSVMDLNRRKAECYGAPKGGELYDALMDDFEPGMLASEVEAIFKPLRERLTPLIAAIADAPKRPTDAPNEVKVDRAKQIALNKRMAAAVGFDFDAGALEVSTHPFSEPIAPGDTRMTTRYFDDRFLDSLAATLHESGHSLYEQGLPKDEHFGEPLADSISLGIHESQSRTWENQVGRSMAFWEWATPIVHETFGDPVKHFGPKDFFGAANLVEPSFIRVEADEATYSLHVMLRFDIERAILRGDVSVDDIPGWWNERMKKDLGLTVPDDSKGCLQDIHWSMGAVGYFPTYTLGTLYSAQFWDAMCEAVPDVDGKIRKGEFAPLLEWMRKNIHSVGKRYRARELCEKVTGRTVDFAPYLDYLEAKLKPVYGL